MIGGADGLAPALKEISAVAALEVEAVWLEPRRPGRVSSVRRGEAPLAAFGGARENIGYASDADMEKSPAAERFWVGAHGGA